MMPVHAPDTVSLTNLILTTSVFLYSLAHFTLLVVASMAWTSAHRFVQSPECLGIAGLATVGAAPSPRSYCGFTRWGLYFFISVAAFVCFLTTAAMTFNGLCRSSRGRRSAALDPGYVLKGILVTLGLLLPLVWIGWQDVTVVAPEPVEANLVNSTSVNGTANATTSFEGLSGVFVLEIMDKSSPITQAALIITHFNL
jgi:hypothetical protein